MSKSVVNDERVRPEILTEIAKQTERGSVSREELVSTAMGRFELQTTADRRAIEKLIQEEVKAGAVLKTGNGRGTKYTWAKKGQPAEWKLEPEGKNEPPYVVQVVGLVGGHGSGGPQGNNGKAEASFGAVSVQGETGAKKTPNPQGAENPDEQDVSNSEPESECRKGPEIIPDDAEDVEAYRDDSLQFAEFRRLWSRKLQKEQEAKNLKAKARGAA